MTPSNGHEFHPFAPGADEEPPPPIDESDALSEPNHEAPGPDESASEPLPLDQIPGYYDREKVIAELGELTKLDPIPTGFELLDKTIGGGLFTTQVGVFVGPTGVGKTSLFMGICTKVSADGRIVVVWTLEMLPPMLAAREASQRSGDPSIGIIRNPEIQARNLENISPGIHYYRGRAPEEVRQILRTLAPEGGALLVVDYLQKVAMSDEEMRAAVTEASEAIRVLAVEERCAVLVVSSTSRAGTKLLYESRKHAPHELEGVGKESGAIEYDAATIITLGPDPEVEPIGSLAIVSVAKARWGRTAQFEYRFEGATGRWEELRALPGIGERDIGDKAEAMLDSFRDDWRANHEPRSYTFIRDKFGNGRNDKRKAAFRRLVETRALEPVEVGGETLYQPRGGDSDAVV